MIYSPDDVKRMLDYLYKNFEGQLSDGEDSTYAKILKKCIKELEKKI